MKTLKNILFASVLLLATGQVIAMKTKKSESKKVESSDSDSFFDLTSSADDSQDGDSSTDSSEQSENFIEERGKYDNLTKVLGENKLKIFALIAIVSVGGYAIYSYFFKKKKKAQDEEEPLL